VSETSSGPLRVRSVVGLAYDELRAMIVDGPQPGARPGGTADALGIARLGARALRRLRETAWSSSGNRGFFVATSASSGCPAAQARPPARPGIARLAAERARRQPGRAAARVAGQTARTAAAARRQPRPRTLVASARATP
jgi:hypothetical protein